MAKTGTITAPTGADVNLRTLGDSTPPRYTLAGVIRAALQLAVSLKKAIVNFGERKAVVVPVATDVSSVSGSTGMVHCGVLTKDDPTKASSPWSRTGGAGTLPDIEGAIDAIVAARKPAMSFESLANAIEDLHEDAEGPVQVDSLNLVLIANQSTGEVEVFSVPDANSASAHTAAVALTEDAQFVQTLDSGSTQQFE